MCLVFVTVILLNVNLPVECNGKAFNFIDKLRQAEKLKQESVTQTSQIIRVPNLKCPNRMNLDRLGKCRPSFD